MQKIGHLKDFFKVLTLRKFSIRMNEISTELSCLLGKILLLESKITAKGNPGSVFLRVKITPKVLSNSCSIRWLYLVSVTDGIFNHDHHEARAKVEVNSLIFFRSLYIQIFSPWFTNSRNQRAGSSPFPSQVVLWSLTLGKKPFHVKTVFCYFNITACFSKRISQKITSTMQESSPIS